MKRILKYLSLVLCLVVALSSCDDYIDEFDTHKDEYSVRYSVTYSTVYDFHNIAHFSYTNFFDGSGYTGKPRQIEHNIDGTEAYIYASRVPKGAHVELSTYIDVPEALPNTKVEIKIKVAKGKEYDYTEVAKATAECPLKDNPLTISYDIPNN